MERFGFLIFLLVLAVIEATINLHLALAGVLVLLNFVPLRSLIWWAFALGFVLDLLLGNFLGLNSQILLLSILIWHFGRQFFWHNLNYAVFPRQTMVVVSSQVVITSRFYDFFYNLANFGIVSFDFKLKTIPVEIILTLILFPIVSYFAMYWVTRQLELKF